MPKRIYKENKDSVKSDDRDKLNVNEAKPDPKKDGKVKKIPKKKIKDR